MSPPPYALVLFVLQLLLWSPTLYCLSLHHSIINISILLPYLFQCPYLSPPHTHARPGVMEFGSGSYPTPSQGITLIQSPVQSSGGLTLQVQAPHNQPQGLTLIPAPSQVSNQVGGLSLVQTPTQQSPLDPQQVISQDFSFNTIQEQQPDHHSGASKFEDGVYCAVAMFWCTKIFTACVCPSIVSISCDQLLAIVCRIAFLYLPLGPQQHPAMLCYSLRPSCSQNPIETLDSAYNYYIIVVIQQQPQILNYLLVLSSLGQTLYLVIYAARKQLNRISNCIQLFFEIHLVQPESSSVGAYYIVVCVALL